MRLVTCEACGVPYQRKRRGRYNRCDRCMPAQAPNPRHDAEYQRNRSALLAGDPACHWCGAPATTADHLGDPTDHRVGNLVPACGPCNSSRGGQKPRTQRITVAGKNNEQRQPLRLL